MNGFRFRNKFLKTRPNMDNRAYNAQSNGYLTLVMKAKKDCYNNSDHKNVTDNKTFWNYVNRPFFQKNGTFFKIMLVEQDLILDKKKLLQKCLTILYKGSFSSKFTKLSRPLRKYRLY